MATNSYPPSQAFCTLRVNASDVSPSHTDSSGSPHIGPWPGSFFSSDSSDASDEPFRLSSTQSLRTHGAQEEAGSAETSLASQSDSMRTKTSADAVEQARSQSGASVGLPAGALDHLYVSLPGSAGHTQGMCRPCHYFYSRSGCANGENCHFCHLRHTKKPRMRLSKLERQQCRALAQMVFDLQGACAEFRYEMEMQLLVQTSLDSRLTETTLGESHHVPFTEQTVPDIANCLLLPWKLDCPQLLASLAKPQPLKPKSKAFHGSLTLRNRLWR